MAEKKRRTQRKTSIAERAEVHAAGVISTVATAGIVAAGEEVRLTALALAAASPLVAYIGGLMARTVTNFGTRRLLQFWQRIIESDSEQETRKKLEQFLAKPHADEIVAQGFRQLMDVLDEAVIPVVADLTIEYQSQDRKPDPFFRAVGNLLANATADDLKSLRALLETLRRHTASEENGYLASYTAHIVRYLDGHRLRINSISSLVEDISACPHAPEGLVQVFHLLKTSGLGRDAMGGVLDSMSGPTVLVIDGTTVQAISNILRKSENLTESVYVETIEVDRV